MIKSRIFRWAGHVAIMKDSRGAFNILIGNPTGNRPSGSPGPIWEDNIRINLR